MNPAVRQLLLKPGGGTNIWQYTESLGSNRYAVGSATLGADYVSHNGISLRGVSAANFFSSITTNFSGLGLAPFVSGQRYLMSYYIFNRGTSDNFFWMRPLANTGSTAHGAKLAPAGSVRRVWEVVHAVASNGITHITTPTTALGGEAQANYWFVLGTTEGAALDCYVGGFQLEPVSSTYKDGIAMIGDSTMEGASGAADSSATTAREVSIWLGALLNVPVFNRANSGEQTGTMDARWATDITPLAVNCKYAIIQGGINDFANSVALATAQANTSSMAAKAEADGLLPVHFTCTPAAGIASNGANEANRVAFNAWLMSTFPRVVDIATALADPSNPSALNPAWVGDGTHYTQAGKQAAARLAAQMPFWSFQTPSRYKRVIGLP